MFHRGLDRKSVGWGALSHHKDGLLSVAYGNLVGVLIEAVKELSEKVERFEARA